MALQTVSKIENKKGGPYTKKQQEKRRKQVYQLHFEQGYPARKIAEILKVNRNTINSDINSCYSQLALDWKDQDFKKWIVKQLERFELQRSRLYEELENCNTLSEKLSIEKIILDIDQKISQIVTKLLLNYKYNFSISDEDDKNEEDQIQKVVKSLVKKGKFNPKSCCYTDDEIIEEAVKLIKCGILEAESLILEMRDLGLDFYEREEDDEIKYDVLEFSQMRGYNNS